MNKLKPEDVPGAILFHSEVKLNSLKNLQRWLSCRGLSYQGKKNEVIKRFVGTFVRLCCHIIYVNIVFFFVLELKTA